MTTKKQSRKEFLSEEYVKKLQDANSKDKEAAHCKADDLLCELLEKLGFDEVVAEFKKLNHWCA